jgi:hypothetical protein
MTGSGLGGTLAFSVLSQVQRFLSERLKTTG